MQNKMFKIQNSCIGDIIEWGLFYFFFLWKNVVGNDWGYGNQCETMIEVFFFFWFCWMYVTRKSKSMGCSKIRKSMKCHQPTICFFSVIACHRHSGLLLLFWASLHLRPSLHYCTISGHIRVDPHNGFHFDLFGVVQ